MYIAYVWAQSNVAGPPRATEGPLLIRRKDTNQTIKDKRISSVRAHAIVHNNTNMILWPTCMYDNMHIGGLRSSSNATTNIIVYYATLIYTSFIIPRPGDHVHTTCVYVFRSYSDKHRSNHNGPRVRTRSVHV